MQLVVFASTGANAMKLSTGISKKTCSLGLPVVHRNREQSQLVHDICRGHTKSHGDAVPSEQMDNCSQT